MLKSVQQEVCRRDRGAAVRMNVAADADEVAVAMLTEAVGLSREWVFRVEGPQNLSELGEMGRALEHHKAMRDEPFLPQQLPPLRDEDNIFEIVARGDVPLSSVRIV